MIGAIRYTIKDICLGLGGISRSKVHSWTRLEPFSRMETAQRYARYFSLTDFLTLAVLQTLEDDFGIKNKQLGLFSVSIHRYLSEPGSLMQEEYLFLSIRDGCAVPASSPAEPGIIIDIASERERINRFLGIASPQRELALLSQMDGKG